MIILKVRNLVSKINKTSDLNSNMIILKAKRVVKAFKEMTSFKFQYDNT